MPDINTVPANPETAPYWEALQKGRFLIKACTSCGERHFNPRAGCPFCFAADTTWVEASGEGEIYALSWSAGPLGLAYVTLAEGPTMMTNIVDCTPGEVAIGQRVRLVVRPGQDGAPAPMFTPA